MRSWHWQQIHERAYPYLWALIAAAVTYHFKIPLDLHLSETQISTTTTIASILMGFLGTSYGILLSSTTKRIEWAKGKVRIWHTILGFFNQSFVANFALCVYSIILSFFVTQSPLTKHEDQIFIAWSFLLTLSIVSFFRAMRVLFGLLRSDSI